MNPSMIAQIEWPFLILALFVGWVMVTWRSFRRLVRDVNVRFAEGDYVGSLEAALRMRRAWHPLALLERLVWPGRQELVVASRCFGVSDPAEALRLINESIS